MSRSAVTVSISMPPETRELMDRLRGSASQSEYVRRLVEAEVARRGVNEAWLALARLADAQAEIPDSWRRDDLPDLLEDVLVARDPAALIGAEVDAAWSLEKLGPATR
jgi:Arc/MetJ-type ribon-helix-helix transcriptional regulator